MLFMSLAQKAKDQLVPFASPFYYTAVAREGRLVSKSGSVSDGLTAIKVYIRLRI